MQLAWDRCRQVRGLREAGVARGGGARAGSRRGCLVANRRGLFFDGGFFCITAANRRERQAGTDNKGGPDFHSNSLLLEGNKHAVSFVGGRSNELTLN